jgi:serine protein kinase
MAFASLHVAGTTASSTDLMVSTPAGRIRGVAANNAALFRTVPFAQPPVGQLRFRPPVPAKPWPGVRNATEFAPAAIQLAETSFAQSEDCLYLNAGGRTGAVEWNYGPLRLAHSSLSGAPCAPGTLDMMAQFSVLTRLKEPENSSLYSKMRVYDGETLKDVDPKAKTLQEYRDYAGPDEGMSGMSTRFAYKILSAVFNYDQTEIAANPVHLMYVLEQRLAREDLPDDTRRRAIEHIKGYLAPRYAEFIGKEIQTAYLESYSEYGQNIFDRYVTYADCWIQEEDYRDPETGESFDRAALNAELEKIEKPAGIANPKDFRNEIVNFVLRARAHNNGRNPAWSSYEKLREVIEKKMFSNTEDLLPVISFNAKASADEKEKHQNFVARMVAKGYTEKQVRLLAEWYLRVHKSS